MKYILIAVLFPITVPCYLIGYALGLVFRFMKFVGNLLLRPFSLLRSN